MKTIRSSHLFLALALVALLGLAAGCGRIDERRRPTPSPQSEPALEIKGQHVVFRRAGCLWSDPSGGQCFGERKPGYEVEIDRLEGRRLLIFDLGNGRQTAYVDLDDVGLSKEVLAAIRATLGAGSKTVVGIIARPSDAYHQTAEALRRLGTWAGSAPEGLRLQLLWADELAAGSRAEITPLVQFPRRPVLQPIPSNCPPTDPRCHRDRDAVIEANKDKVTDHEARMAELRATVKRQLSEAAESTVSSPADPAVAFQRGAALLEGAPGIRWLLIAAPLSIDPATLGSLPLGGVQIRVIFPEVASLAQLRDLETTWRSWAAEQRASLKILDASLELDVELL